MKNYTDPQKFVEYFNSIESRLQPGLYRADAFDPPIDHEVTAKLLAPYEAHLSLCLDSLHYGDFGIGKNLPKSIFSVELTEPYLMSEWGNIPEGYEEPHGVIVTYGKDRKWRISSNVYSLDDEFNAAFPQLVEGYDRLDELLMILELTR